MRKLVTGVFAAAVLLASNLPAQVITGYDIYNARPSGFGGWSHTYSGTVTNIGGGLANYSGAGSGTMNDGAFSTSYANSQLFSASDGAVIVLYLNGTYNLSNLNIYGGSNPGNGIPGAIYGATFTFGAVTTALSSTPFSVSGSCSDAPCDDGFSFAMTALAGESSNFITISNVQASGPYGDFFSISEIGLDGTETETTPEPASLALMFTGLVAVGVARRNRKSAR